jgi:thiamine-monophosphate kinase
VSSVDIGYPNDTIGDMKVGDIGEWQLMELIREKLTLSTQNDVLVDVGDDAACVRLKELTLLTTDSYLEEVHFVRSHYDFREIGYRSMAASLSDVAAMGGEPRFALISLQLPTQTTIDHVEQLYAGIQELADRFAFRIVGGDTIRSEKVGIVCTVIGEATHVIRRSGAAPGDSIMVTGELGSSSLGFHLMKAGFIGERAIPFIEAHKRPCPRLVEGRVLAGSGVVNAMIDISDGLALDLHHLTTESRVGAEIYSDQLPINEESKELALESGRTLEEFILYGGEDYELLFTLPVSEVTSVCGNIHDRTQTSVAEIGRITEKKDVVVWRGDEPLPLPRRGYDHFGDLRT